ncbi:hypothetical protein NSK_001310 [Nannochloropsis salina CCMP1776]|uniref:Major facilitator superfamily (MFS) profile domain-containing protein n=1 Tax=Nannochloropsis salina CCMP1776 TaxID=1027361 RepID=A0A4D9D6H6_9STRA|nr:hypothetical protein NSK_001310 [Nannochloropsis salina CCMP1776]|eukprot:TFJ86976.1 hypothetical protein NSK_001310 [Nannochloropsis salina CCMP1776]
MPDIVGSLTMAGRQGTRLARIRGGASRAARVSPSPAADAKKHQPAASSSSPKDGALSEDLGPPSTLTFKNAPSSLRMINGVFTRTDWDHNGRAHYEKVMTSEEMTLAQEFSVFAEERRVVHLYWHGSQWVLHLDLDPALNYDNYLGYCKVNSRDPGRTDRSWLLRENKKWLPATSLRVHVPGRQYEKREESASAAAALASIPTPPRLVPVFIAFFLDAVGTGLASPLLPFYIMSLGANAFQLGLVLAFNYLAQTIGCIVMGSISDRCGRRQVMLCCLMASFVSLSLVARAKTLPQVAIGRVIGGMFGGFVPLAQSAVADLVPVEGRAKFLGRIQACMGAGFVAGPLLGLLGSRGLHLDSRGILKRAAILPALAFSYGLVFIKETKDAVAIDRTFRKKESRAASLASSPPSLPKARDAGWSIPSFPVRLLILNGFLLMYAFSVETVYAMFIKDNFGYGETALGAVFALNGIAVGLLQVFLIKNLFARLGKHVMLAFGNLLLALGMVGLSLLRYKLWHFSMFSLHIIGYAISDTALASLISRYSAPEHQGRNLGWSHAAQSCARIISPLVAGILYEWSKEPGHPLPPGALPYIAGSAFPLLGVMVPTVLYLKSIERKRLAAEED